MIILNNDGGYIFNKAYPNTNFTDREVIQIVDDNSELGQKIISMIPNVKLIYTDGLVTDCEEIVEPTLEERISTLEAENDLQDETIIALYEDNLTLTEQMASQTSINDGQDASIIEIYELLLNA